LAIWRDDANQNPLRQNAKIQKKTITSPEEKKKQQSRHKGRGRGGRRDWPQNRKNSFGRKRSIDAGLIINCAVANLEKSLPSWKIEGGLTRKRGERKTKQRHPEKG